MTTYWLYHGRRVLTSIRHADGATDQQVIGEAISRELWCPLGHAPHEAPYEFMGKLHRATVRTFDDGRPERK